MVVEGTKQETQEILECNIDVPKMASGKIFPLLQKQNVSTKPGAERNYWCQEKS